MQEEAIRVETHQIKEGTSFYGWAVQECSLNTSLYNRTLYILRQAFSGKHENIPEYTDIIRKEKFISVFDLITRMRKLNDKDFRSLLKDNEAAQTVKKCAESFSTWFRSLNSYKKNPQKFTGKPKMPRYKKEANGDKLFSVAFSYNDAKIQKDGTINIRKDFKLREAGINVETHNESHTSKCSFLDDEDICHYDEYMGKRKKRGLFVSSVGCMLNADINGAANILRRGLGKTFSPHKSMFNPIKNRYRKEAPDVGLRPRRRGWGFTHCLDGNINTLSLTA